MPRAISTPPRPPVVSIVERHALDPERAWRGVQGQRPTVSAPNYISSAGCGGEMLAKGRGIPGPRMCMRAGIPVFAASADQRCDCCMWTWYGAGTGRPAVASAIAW